MHTILTPIREMRKTMKKSLKFYGRMIDVVGAVYVTWGVVAVSSALLYAFGAGRLVLGFPIWVWVLAILGTSGAVRIYGDIERRREGLSRYVFVGCCLLTLIAVQLCLAMTLSSGDGNWTRSAAGDGVGGTVAKFFGWLGLVVAPVTSLASVGWLRLNKGAAS